MINDETNESTTAQLLSCESDETKEGKMESYDQFTMEQIKLRSLVVNWNFPLVIRWNKRLWKYEQLNNGKRMERESKFRDTPIFSTGQGSGGVLSKKPISCQETSLFLVGLKPPHRSMLVESSFLLDSMVKEKSKFMNSFCPDARWNPLYRF